MPKKIFLMAGEPSGDLHASRLAGEIKKIAPEAELCGVGGPLMAKEGVRLFHSSDELSIVGVADVIKKFPRIKRVFRDFLMKADEERPDGIVLVDYPGFNLKMAAALKRKGFKVIYYISPQIWAWGGWRINKIRRYVDKILVFFGFEKKIYEEAGIPVEFVGHPLIDSVRPAREKNEIRNHLMIDEGKRVVTLLPGSRPREIDFLLPKLVLAANHLYKRHGKLHFVIVKSESIEEGVFARICGKLKVPYSIVENGKGRLYDVLSVSDIAVAASGTVTLECAIMGVPIVIVYKVSLLNAVIMKPFMRVSSIGLVNVIAGKKIVPELVQLELTVPNICREAERLLFNEEDVLEMRRNLSAVKSELGEKGASRRAAEAVIKTVWGV